MICPVCLHKLAMDWSCPQCGAQANARQWNRRMPEERHVSFGEAEIRALADMMRGTPNLPAVLAMACVELAVLKQSTPTAELERLSAVVNGPWKRIG